MPEPMQGPVERFERLIEAMPRISRAVNGFGEDLRQNVFYTLVGVLDPDPDADDLAVLELTEDRDQLQAQIDRLADFITAEVPGEPSRSEGAVDCAIRLLADLVRPAAPLAEVDPALVEVLAGAGSRWGPLGVARVAAAMAKEPDRRAYTGGGLARLTAVGAVTG